MPTKQATAIKVSLKVPEEIYDEYAERATKFGRTVEQEMFLRLKNCRDHNAITGIYFNDDQRAEIQKALGHVITGPEMVLERLKTLLSLKVGNVEIPLSERLQIRLRTRVFRGQTIEKVLQKEVTEGLERYVGLRPY